MGQNPHHQYMKGVFVVVLLLVAWLFTLNTNKKRKIKTMGAEIDRLQSIIKYLTHDQEKRKVRQKKESV